MHVNILCHAFLATISLIVYGCQAALITLANGILPSNALRGLSLHQRKNLELKINYSNAFAAMHQFRTAYLMFGQLHYSVRTWKCFHIIGAFKWAVMRNFINLFFVVDDASLNELLNKHWNCRWIETSCFSCDMWQHTFTAQALNKTDIKLTNGQKVDTVISWWRHQMENCPCY